MKLPDVQLFMSRELVSGMTNRETQQNL